MGGFKDFQDPYWFTCCIGTGMENHAKYSRGIFYHNDQELYVNQFIASILNWYEDSSANNGEFKNRKYREVDRGGWMTFNMKTIKNQPFSLVFEY